MGAQISIIVPIYNVEMYLPKCISSILQQTYQDIQVILVDDGSTDRSGKICDDFSKTDDRVEVIHKKNGGLVSARKAGLAAARGQYIGFVDGDDYIDPNMYGDLLDNLICTGADFVHTGLQRNGMHILQLTDEVLDISQNKAGFIEKYILSTDSEEHINHSVVTKLFKAEFIRQCYSEVPDSQAVGEDLINLIICILQGNRMSILNASYYHYTARNTSITQERNDTAYLTTIRLFQIIENILKKYDCYAEMKDMLEKDWLRLFLCSKLSQASYDRFKIQCYGIKDMSALLDKKIVIYGAGKIGRDYYAQICRYSRCKIAGWIDQNYQNIHYECVSLQGREDIKRLDFDILIIAVKYEKNALQIKKNLIEEDDVNEAKIMWIKPFLY